MAESGEAKKSANDYSSEEKEVEEVSCIAKFRPWEDWRGEYGFDWVREGPDDYEEENIVFIIKDKKYDLVQGDEPFEYLYSKKYVKSVKYYLSKANNNGAWYYEIETMNDGQGSKSADSSVGRMFSYVELEDPDGKRKKCSLLSCGKKLYFPIYDVDPCVNKMGGGQIVKTVLFELNDYLFTIEYSYAKESESIRVKLEIEKGKKRFGKGFRYTVFNNVFYYSLLNNMIPKLDKDGIIEKDEKGKEKYVRNPVYVNDEELNEDNYNFKKSNRPSLLDIKIEDEKDSERERFEEAVKKAADAFLKECFRGKEQLLDDIYNNRNITIARLSKDDAIDNITITIEQPTELFKDIDLSEYGLEINEDDRCWHGQKVCFWREALENDNFTVKDNIVLKNKTGDLVKDNRGKIVRLKYIVPTLSIGNFDVENTIFDFRWVDKWAPHKKTFKPSEGIPIQVNLEWESDSFKWEGKKPKFLKFETTNPDVLKVNPCDELKNPSKVFTIKLFPDIHPFTRVNEEFQVNVVAKGKNSEDDCYKEIGELKVELKKKEVLPIWFIKVYNSEFGFDTDHLKAIEEQEQALQNALYQAGIKLYLRYGSIFMNASEGTVNLDEMRDIFIAKYDKNGDKGYCEEILVFFVPFESGSKLGFCQGNSILIYDTYIKIRRKAYTTAHEVGHALGLTHSFRCHSDRKDNAFCFGMAETSNIMDYGTKEEIQYSFRKYQWDTMRMELDTLNKKMKQNVAIRDLKSRVLRLWESIDF